MNPVPDNCLPGKNKKSRLPSRALRSGRFVVALLLCTPLGGVWAQTLTWTDSFVQGDAPTEAQCLNWSTFLDQLEGKSFGAVTMTGQYDPVGKTITDPEAARELADLLSSGTPGTVTSNGNTWTVTRCDISICGNGYSIALSVNGNTEACDCDDTYAIRPQSKNENWGGINTGTSCFAKSQYMKLEFHSGVSIIAEQVAGECQEVKLTAECIICSAPYTYRWSNGETTPSITVSEPGEYSVTVTDASGTCGGTSLPYTVSSTGISVEVNDPVTACNTPVQLTATGISPVKASTMVNQVCMFDSPGMIGSGLCNFVTSSVCLEGQTSFGNTVFSKAVSFVNPVELRFNLYYSADWYTDFILKVNGQKVGSYREGDPSGVCEEIVGGKAPRTIIVTADKFRDLWDNNTENVISIEISTNDASLHLAGLTVDVVTSSESYSWSPATALNSASISNPVATPTETTTYTVTYTDANGCTATNQVEVKVECATPPVAVCQAVTVPLDANCQAFVPAEDFDGGSVSPSGSPLEYIVSPAGPYLAGTTAVMLIVSDASGLRDTCYTSVTVKDLTPPAVVTPLAVEVRTDEGSCSATVELPQPQASDNCGGTPTITNDYAGNEFPKGETIVTWTLTDAAGNMTTATQSVVVLNPAPVILSVAPSASSAFEHRAFSLEVSYDDNNVTEAVVDWGDGAAPEVVAAPAAVFEVSHIYQRAGAFSAKVTVTDACGESSYSYESIVVQKNGRGSVSGGGWFDSPRGAYRKDPRSAGKATFSLDVNNTNSSSEPRGDVIFNLRSGDIKFRSTSIEWMDVTEGAATIKAVGRIGHKANYQMKISLLEEPAEGNSKDNRGKKSDKKKDRRKKSLDYIRVQIWDPSGAVLYDTQFQSPEDAEPALVLKGGSVRIDAEETGFTDGYESPVAWSFGEESTAVYPNPFVEYVNVQFNTGSKQDVVIIIMDLAGRVVFNKVFPASEDGNYVLDIFEEDEGNPGIYIAVIKQGYKVDFLRLVKE